MMASWVSNYFLATNVDFSSFNGWNMVLIAGVLFFGIGIAGILKNNFKFLHKTLLPASVLGGIILLIFVTIFKAITGNNFFELTVFNIGNSENGLTGNDILQFITYHCLGLGFTAMALRNNTHKGKGSFNEVINTGITTVATYVLQAIFGLFITFVFAFVISNLHNYSGSLLCLGFGQGTGQALNWGSIFENDYGFIGGSNFGLTIAALGFLVACIFGVIYLNILKKQGKIKVDHSYSNKVELSDYQGDNEINLTGTIDKFTVQLALVIICYVISYGLMYLLGSLIPSMKSTIFGFNFLLGTVVGILTKLVINFLTKKKIIKRTYVNNFMMNRISGIAFDVMIIAGIAVIDLELLKEYWYVLLILALIGGVATFIFLRFVCKKLFPNYKYEQFMAMFGMLTGTASTGMILLREIDPQYDSPAADNLVYQNLPAILLGIPLIMLYLPKLPSLASSNFFIAILIPIIYFVILMIILFRNQIFKKKTK